MTKTITRVYDDYLVAENTVRDLENAGLGSSHIGIVASNAEGWHNFPAERREFLACVPRQYALAIDYIREFCETD